MPGVNGSRRPYASRSCGLLPGVLFFNKLDPDDQLSSDNDRRDAELSLLREQTTASLTEIAERFQVSEMTVRRDIQKLAASGQVIRVPGGARIERSFGGEKSFFERLQRMGDAKRCIGKAAAALIEEGESVTLDSGTTTLSPGTCGSGATFRFSRFLWRCSKSCPGAVRCASN
jgi:hypothetical protein